MSAAPGLSGRARTALMKHQRQVGERGRELATADRMLAGALVACDDRYQREMLEAYLESVQELRVSLQRLEDFLMKRLSSPGLDAADDFPHEERVLAVEPVRR